MEIYVVFRICFQTEVCLNLPLHVFHCVIISCLYHVTLQYHIFISCYCIMINSCLSYALVSYWIFIMNLYHDHDCWLLQEIVTRLGRWIDFENDYKTMYPTFMESIWWVFKELYNRGLVYKGSKVMPFSTACNTPLSNFESGQNYKDVVDPAGGASFIQ